MAKVRIGFSSHFEVENEKVGIGTDSALANLHATGDIIADNIDISSGITTVKIYDGFVDKKTKITKDPNLNLEAHALSGEIIIEGEVTVSSGTTFTSGPDNLTVTDNFTLPGISDDKPSIGDIRFNENLGAIQVYVGGPEEPIAGAGGTGSPYFPTWRAVNSYVDNGNRGRAVFIGGGDGGGNMKTIDYFSLISKGNAVAWDGETLATESRRAGCGSEIRGLTAGSDDSSNHEIIEYITIASQGDTIDFGDMFNGRGAAASFSSSTRGIWAGGRSPSTSQDTIDYVEIATLGDGLDFGNLTQIKQWTSGCSSPTRGIIGGGEGSGYTTPSRTSDIEYVTIASKGDAFDFGQLTTQTGNPGGFSNSVRGFFAGGEPRNWTKIDMITIASKGNAIHFGDLRQGRIVVNGASSQTRGFILGGMNNGPGAYVNIIESVEIASSGNAIDWGDLTKARWSGASISDSHGGLGGF